MAVIEKRMEERQEKIAEVKDQMNTVEDRLFADFCNQLGIDNIRLE